ncbi:DUF523 domain-containing protein [Radicibacter daui]|uniref:DUF523 domain-containing protein n=1 Tax=Radicibacter daui TaxID=3064829 RepID=UPI004046E508
MERILVSGCLLGQKIRYNGGDKALAHALLTLWQREGRLVAICPELSVGFATPRPAAEIADAGNGNSVLTGKARVIEQTGRDVSALYRAGAEMALSLARQQGCRFALLTDGSPSCGSSFIYDGSFSGARHDGEGVTVALLRQHGVTVFAEHQIDDLARLLAIQEPG